MIGQGTFAKVYSATNLKTEALVAVKVIRRESMSEADYEEQRNEIQLLKVARHPNVVSLFEFFEDRKHIYLVMEMCSTTLLDFLTSHDFKVGIEVRQKLIVEMIGALLALHSKGIIHRDIKLENIMLNFKGDEIIPKLTDFGLSRILQVGEVATEKVGSKVYLAPEIVEGRTYTKAVDTWSLGVVFFALSTGRLPFKKEDSPIAAFNGSRKGQVMSIVADEKEGRLINEMLMLDPAKRIELD